MRESAIEKYLVDEVKKAGGKAYKWVSPGNRGVPDRIAIFPRASTWHQPVMWFVELKAPGKKLSSSQVRVIATLLKLGCNVAVLDSKEMVNEFIRRKHEIRS